MSGVRIWVERLGTDPVLRQVARFPSPGRGERIAEARIIDAGGAEAVGWLIRHASGRIFFADDKGSVRTVDPAKAEQALAHIDIALPPSPTGRGFRSLLDEVGYSQSGFAREWGVSDRNVRRWCAGDLDVPTWAEKALQMMLDHGIRPGPAS